MALQPGEIIEGKYRIVRLIGEGGMGAVYEGENTRIKRRIAIKVLHSQVAEKTDVVQRFEREAQAAGRIGSEHIVEVLDLGNLPSGERFMVMEYLDGEDLTSRIRGKKRLTPHESIPILHQVLEGLFAAHAAGIFHRDLKPDNIYLLKSKAGRADFVKILDFGVSKFSTLDGDMAQTRAGAVMGTPYYMSPEQAKGGTIDGRSDLYAVGVVLYQMTTGRVPFNAGSFNELLFKIALETPEPVDKVVPDLPQSFAQIITKAMARTPEARYQTAREFQDALAQWQMTAPPEQLYSGTQPMPAMPDMSAPPHLNAPTPTGIQGTASGPGATMPGGGSYPSYPGAVIPGTNTAYPDTGTPMQGSLATSHQVALAVTQSGPKRRRSTLVALVVVMAGIVGLGAAGVYLALTPAGTAADGAASDGTATAARDARDAETAEETAAAEASSDETTAAETAEPDASAAEADATAEPSSEPAEQPVAAAQPPRPTYRPPPPKTTKPPAEPPPEKPKPTPKPGGRRISTEL